MRRLKRGRALALVLPIMLGLLASACDPDPSTEEDGIPASEGTDETNTTPPVPYGYAAAQAAGSDTYWESNTTITLYDAVVNGTTTVPATADRTAFSAGDVQTITPGPVRDTNNYVGFNEPGREGSVSAQSLGTPSAAGCRGAVNDVRLYSTVFRAELWRWHHRQDWCWLGGRVWNPTAKTYFDHVDSIWNYEGRVYREWFYYDNYRGHKGLRKDKFSSCLAWFCNYKYPWMWYRKHSDGTYTWDRGIG